MVPFGKGFLYCACGEFTGVPFEGCFRHALVTSRKSSNSHATEKHGSGTMLSNQRPPESLEEIFRLVLVGNGLFSLHAPAMDAVVVVVVAEGRGKQRRRGSGSALVNPSNRTEREDGARHAARIGAMCPNKKAMVRRTCFARKVQ